MQSKISANTGLLLLAALIHLSVVSAATAKEDFLVRNVQDLIDLCTTPADDPLNVAAVHFCTGYLVGAYHYHESEHSGPDSRPLVCPPDPKPTRQEAIAEFVSWTQAHPEYNNERPVDVMFRFLAERWPCRQTPLPGMTK
ncbi:Rap1a/Tai family immunity protein [Methylocaldum szegediense]|uniref:Rap1a domain-containing protein n=1 Tax=Methylocaldum szegediense TaxID=73780 RepID=A0ABN8X806_9GAMM|nr:Rap1a/Tai family immunity protein [Methylocaldum szegediense]CAI8891111.1 Rap1a domain-containing protein [Methylocaldum szegediense]